jgi:predicted dehydrogenase
MTSPGNSGGVLRCGLVGGGMFGGDVVLRTIEDLARCGVAPYLGRIGLDTFARELYGVSFALAAVGTRTQASAERLAAAYAEAVGGPPVAARWGERPWEPMLEAGLDILFVATPDDLHTAPALAALAAGTHVVAEKPLCLHLEEADELVRAAATARRILGVDMHKRYDPCHRYLFRELVPRLGTLNYGRAVLEEPLEVSTRTFKWAARSNPFSYVGVHWVDLFEHYLRLRPRTLHAVGQKNLLARWPAGPIDTFDSMQVVVGYEGGLSVAYVNAWINPPEFEGPVNQEMELVGVRGRVEFDQQDRGLRAAIAGLGSRTFNPHFAGDVPRFRSAAPAYDGYGKDSLVACAACAALVATGRATPEELLDAYPNALDARQAVGVLEAAAAVAERNWTHAAAGRGAPATARWSEDGIEIVDPAGGNELLYRGNPWR